MASAQHIAGFAALPARASGVVATIMIMTISPSAPRERSDPV